MTRRRGALVGVVAALVLAAVAVPAVGFLTSENPRRSGTDAVTPDQVVATLQPGDGLCQVARLPTDTAAIELAVAEANPRTQLRLQLLALDGRTVGVVRTVSVRAGALRFDLPRTLARDFSGRVCLRLAGGPAAGFLGSLDKRGLAVNGRGRRAGIAMTYYRPGKESLLAMAPVIAHRIGLTRGRLGGGWWGVAVVVLAAAGLALALWLVVALAQGRAPRRVAWLIAAVAVLNSLAWSLLTPTFQVPDEPFHLSYVQDLAEHGEPPKPERPPDRYSDELGLIVTGSALVTINFDRAGRPNWTDQANRQLNAELARKPSTDNPGAISSVRDYPPLYYAGLVPVYAATHAAGGSTLDALVLMRALDSLLAGVTILALVAFLRELFPGRPLLVAGVALICAYQPVFTWIQGGVNPDAWLIPLGAVMFWLFARAWRRGLDRRTAVVLGLVFAALVLVKLSALGFAPGFVLGLAWLAWRERAWRTAVAGLLGAGVPIVLYALLNTLVWDRSLLPRGVSEAAAGPPAAAAVSGFPSYLWQYVLPRVGSMTDFFHAGWLPKGFWTPMWVGRFGWFDYQFPSAVNTAAFVLYVVIAVAALVALVVRHRGGWGLALLYAVLAAGLFGAIARAGYQLRAQGQTIFEQARYLMPLLAIYAVAIALAVSLLRRRAEVAALGLLASAAALNLLGAFILTVRRYYL